MRRRPLRRIIAGFARALGIAASAAILAPVDASGESILLHWTAPGDDGMAGRAAAYELRYSDTPIVGSVTTAWWSGATSAGSLPAPQTAGSREAYAVGGLSAATTYYFVLRTWDDASNVSEYSNVSVRQTAGSGGPLATPTGFEARAVSGGVLLAWDEVNVQGGDGYRLYRRDGAATTAQLVLTAPLSQTAWTDTTVTGGSGYEYSLVTYSASAESPPAVATITLAGDLLTTASTTIHGYPNPARDRVTLRFQGGAADGTPGRVRLVIYDLTGHRIRALLDEVVPAGEQAVEWNCRADAGAAVAPGLYNAILDGPLGRQVTRIAIVP
jgi:hypothetical protein